MHLIALLECKGDCSIRVYQSKSQCSLSAYIIILLRAVVCNDLLTLELCWILNLLAKLMLSVSTVTET